MTGKLTTLLLLAPALLAAAEPGAVPAPEPEEPGPRMAIGDLLDPNSVLTGVMLPSYDKQLRLTSVLRAKTVTIVSKTELDADAVHVRLYQPDRSVRGTIDFARARFDQTTETIRAAGETRLVFDTKTKKASYRATTTASGMVFRRNDSKGFLTGPVVTRVATNPTIAMNTRVSPFQAIAALGTALAVQPLAAAPATEPAPTSVPAPGNDPATRASLKSALDASVAATKTAAEFLAQEDLLAQNSPAAAAEPHQAKPLDVKPGPDDSVIACDGGTFFDGKTGILTYQGNVTVKDPRGSMDGANSLQAFFKRKPKPAQDAPKPDQKAEDKADDKKNPLAGMVKDESWELDKVVATGAVHITLKGKPGEDDIEAGGAIFTYHETTRTVTITGGQPWVRQGGLINRAKQANQTITIIMPDKDDRNQTPSASFSPGGTETIAPLKEMDEQRKARDKAKGK